MWEQGDVTHREQGHEAQHERVFLQGRCFSRRCSLNLSPGWAPQQRLTALQSPGHLSVDVSAGSLQFLASLTEQSLPIPAGN